MKILPISVHQKNSNIIFKSNVVKNNIEEQNIPPTQALRQVDNFYESQAQRILPVFIAYNLEKSQNVDDIYRQTLIDDLGLKNIKPSDLKSILGMQEYKDVLKSFSDDPIHYTTGQNALENGTFRANLHIHSTNSDGIKTIQERLDEAAAYADFVSQKQPEIAPNVPLMIAMTDHDTVEGCKQAVEIIAQEPYKYRNLRVVLGCELSVENDSVSQELNRPINTHILLHCINPFDKELNDLLAQKKEARIKSSKQIIVNCAAKLEKIEPNIAKKLNFDDAKKIHPILKNAVTHIYNSTKDYVQFRALFAKYIENNESLKEEFNQKNFDVSQIDYTYPQKLYFEEIDKNQYWKNYYRALQMMISKKLGITKEQAAAKIPLTPEFTSFLNDSNRIALTEMPEKENLQPQYIGINEAIELMKKQKYGYMGLAHPEKMNIGDFLINRYESEKTISELIKNLKELLPEKILFVETHYQLDENNKQRTRWQKLIQSQVDKSGYLNSGGLDSHKASVFESK